MFNKVITNEIFGAMTDSEKQCKAECEIGGSQNRRKRVTFVSSSYYQFQSMIPYYQFLVDEKIQADVTAPFLLWL